MKLTFPDGSVKEVEHGLSSLEICKNCIGEGLARIAVAAKLNNELVDLAKPVTAEGTFKIITLKDAEGLEIMRHSTGHIMSQAVNRIYKKVKQGVGPAIEDGFYQDFELPQAISPDDLSKIEDEMKKIVKEDFKFERKDISKSEALNLFAEDKYKVEMINELPGDSVSVYYSGEYADLCRGPHVASTGKIGAFKLTKIAGAYWRGDSKNAMLTRIYGVAFPTKKELEAYTIMLEEAAKRDHRKIGKEMDLIMSHDLAPGMPFFLPKGMTMLIELIKFVRQYSYGPGYQEVRTPHIFNLELWKISGHIEHYKENMFCIHHAEDNMDMGIKPMNCPAHMLIFKRDVHSYKELPLRIAETTTLYRNEKTGTLTGLTRVRSLSQDDTHIFLAESQICDEIKLLLEKVKTIYKIFNLEIDEINLSTRPESFLGEKETWDFAESNLKKALESSGLKYRIDEGGGAFYGPKIDVKVKDALGRQWQLATLQLDYQLPKRFELDYDDADGKKKTPVVIHRAILGSMERFLGIIIEHFAGKFPLWLNPVQVIMLPIADRHHKHCSDVIEKMKEEGIRVEFDARTETTSKKVRDAEVSHVNYILVVGDNEVKNKTVNVRTRDNKVLGEKKVDSFIAELKKEISELAIK
jgi:threonyl-tRNA synthetase